MKPPRYSLCLGVSAMGIILASISALSAQTTVYEFDTPSADTYVTNSSANTNYGTNETMRVRRDGNSNYARLSYVKFDLASEGLTSGTVESAELTFVLSSMSSGRTEGTMLVYALNEDYQSGLGQNWGETELTAENAAWNPVDSVPSYVTQVGSFDISSTASGGTTFSISGAALVDFLNSSLSTESADGSYVTFMLFEADNNNYTYWATKENTTLDPTSLSVAVAIPEAKSMALLLGAGVLGFVLFAGRRKRS